MAAIFSRGIKRRKVNILWTKKHPLILGCLLYIIFQLVDESQCSSNSDGNAAKVRKLPSALRVPPAVHRIRSLEWFRDNMKINVSNHSDENSLSSLTSKVDELSEGFKKIIWTLRANNKSECNNSKINTPSGPTEFTINNKSIILAKNSENQDTEIDIPVSSVEIPENLHVNKEAQLGEATQAIEESEEISAEIQGNLHENEEPPSKLTSETLKGLNSIETLPSTNSPNVDVSLNDSSDNVETTQNYDYGTAPRNDESNKSQPTIPSTMEGVSDDQDYEEHNQQAIGSNQSLAVDSQDGSSPTQPVPSDSYRMSEESSSTTEKSSSTSENSSSTSEPSSSTSEPSSSTSEPSSNTSEPSSSTNEQTSSTSEPSSSTSEPSSSTSESSSSTSEPSSSANEQTSSTSEPSYSTSEPSSNTSEQTTSTSDQTSSTSDQSSSISDQSSSTSDQSSSTSKYQSKSSEIFIPKETPKTSPTPASYSTNLSSSQGLEPGYTLKRIILQGVDKIHFSLDENVIKLPQNEADVYLFYYIPKAMNLHRSEEYLYLPNEHNKYYEGGYLKHRYTPGKSNDDFSAYSLHHHKLMHSYAKSKQQTKSASKVPTAQLTSNQKSNSSSGNNTTANQKPKNEDSPTYYFVAPYFENNHTLGNFQLSPLVSQAVQEQMNRAAKEINEEPNDQNVDRNERFERDTIDYVDPYSPDSTDEIKCTGDVKWCADGKTCIAKHKWCNQIVDCPDKSDELHCTCRERMDALKICDHYVDCPNGEDEKGCFGCPEDAFSCDHGIQPPNGTCIRMNQRCDGHYHCYDGSDEFNCELLSDSVDSHETFQVSYSSGYLHRNFRGRWYPACIEIHSEHVWGVQACKAELGVNVRHVEAELLLFHGNYGGKFITHDETGHVFFIDKCKYPGYAVHVKCPSMPCGNHIGQTYFPSSRYVSKRQATPDSKDELIYKALELIVGKSYVDSIRRKRSGRVVQGTVSQPGQWPWLVALYKDGELHCGGSIIDETWILTAGHCVYEYRSHFYEVHAGMLRRFSFSPSEQLRVVTHVIIHPEYSHQDLKNDLALLKVQEPLKFNRWVRPICLPVDRPPWGPIAGTPCKAAGWGSIWEKRPEHPDHLREVRLPIRAQCKDKADREGEEICAGYEQGGMDTCQGDSGGPLLCSLPRAHDQWYVAGVVSHGEGCARPHEPGAYTRVALFIPWIVEHTDNKFLTPARQSSNQCPNIRCSYGGRCLGATRNCDRIVDCLSAEDEIDCLLPMLNPEDDDNKSFMNKYYGSNKPLDEIRIQNRNTTNNHTVLSSKLTSNDSSQARNIPQFQSLSQVVESSSDVATSTDSGGSSLNNEVYLEKRETASYFTCQNLHQNIPLEFYCDTEVDCEDGTDEINCTCADYLKVTNESLICDGIIHCYDLSDENNCKDNNCTNDEFFCYKSRYCIPKELVCDGKRHCAHGEDEYRCYWPIPIATPTPIQNQFDMFGVPLFSDKGVLAYNDHTVWKWQCFPDKNDVDLPKTVQKLAKRLGFKNYTSYDKFLVLDDEVLNRRQHNYCPGLSVDFTVAHVDDESQIPWRVNIFVNGVAKCLGVLVKEEWVMTDQSCCLKLNTSTDYIVAVLGSDEKLSRVIRTYGEQIILVDRIRCDKQANTALMHLHERIQTTERTKSLRIISTLKVLELKKNFLLIFDDTQSAIFELMVTSNCSADSSCYRMKYNTDFCLNSNSSLQFASVISLSKKKEWIFSGIVVESLTCLTDETVVSINISQTSSNENKFVNITQFYYRGHMAYRCALGNEISWENVCNGRGDCRETEDEIDTACQEKKLLIEGGFIRPSCRVDEFECKNAKCVSKSAICNSTNDCGDNTDEPETCSNFTCAAYLNLTSPQKICDSRRDCGDKSDEETCPSLCDFPTSFRCNKSNSCIPLDFVCDGERDCEFGEDEEECISYRITDHNGTEGAIWMRSYGQWRQHCFTPGEMVSFDAQNLCKLFGYSQVTHNRTTPATSHIYEQFIRVKLNNFVELTLRRDGEKQFDSMEYCEHLYLTCS